MHKTFWQRVRHTGEEADSRRLQATNKLSNLNHDSILVSHLAEPFRGALPSRNNLEALRARGVCSRTPHLDVSPPPHVHFSAHVSSVYYTIFCLPAVLQLVLATSEFLFNNIHPTR